jgi:DNA-binding transcriptional LysR family regulator
MARPLDPASLQTFVAVCEEGSIARAAVRESQVPSALSKRVLALEAEVGVPLLERHSQGVRPTPAGEALLGRAREVLAQLERVRAELGEFGAGVQGSVRVLASPSVLAEHLPEDIAAFLRRHTALRVSLDERQGTEVLRGLRESAADLGVLWDQGDTAGLEVSGYRSDHLCVVMAAGHPLARRSALGFADILDQPAICISPGGLLDQLLRRQASYRMQVSSMDAACRLIAAGLGLAIVPREVPVALAGAGRLALVPLAETWAERRFVVVTRPAPLASAYARLLAEFLRGVTG